MACLSDLLFLTLKRPTHLFTYLLVPAPTFRIDDDTKKAGVVYNIIVYSYSPAPVDLNIQVSCILEEAFNSLNTVPVLLSHKKLSAK